MPPSAIGLLILIMLRVIKLRKADAQAIVTALVFIVGNAIFGGMFHWLISYIIACKNM